jgi:hypothetical protein
MYSAGTTSFVGSAAMGDAGISQHEASSLDAQFPVALTRKNLRETIGFTSGALKTG